jgi:hypothetical protein
MLWIAIGIQKSIIPKYEFVIKKLEPYEEENKLLALYKRPYPKEFPLEHISNQVI